MDTSTIDIFGEIRELCKNNECKLFICGLSPRQKKSFTKAGLKQDRSGPRGKRMFMFFSDLDAGKFVKQDCVVCMAVRRNCFSHVMFHDASIGLGRAEDVLIQEEMKTSDVLAYHPRASFGNEKSGFRAALYHIDDLHGIEYAEDLFELERHMKYLELNEGQLLYAKDGADGAVLEDDHGLFFIESGM
jgi:hypothetical protein